LLLSPHFSFFISFTLTLIFLATKTQGHEDAQRFFHSKLLTLTLTLTLISISR
jgi:hypothetical protein